MSQNSKDYLLDHIRKAKNEIYFYFTGWNLPFFRQSIDKEIFEETDINKNYKRKTFFMSHRIVFGSNTAKRLVIGRLKKIKEHEQRESTKGRKMYNSYRELIYNCNISKL